MSEETGLLGDTRVARDLPIFCPAGVPIGETIRGAGCHCLITDTEVSSALDPSSLGSFCVPVVGYTHCPVWRRAKEHYWARRDNRADVVADSRAAPRSPYSHPAMKQLEVEGAGELVVRDEREHPALAAFMDP